MGQVISANRDQTNVPIGVFISRDIGVTGLTVIVRIYNGDDPTEFLDFADGVFKAAGHGTPTLTLTEALTTGRYEVAGGFDLSSPGVTVPVTASSLRVQYEITAGGETGEDWDTVIFNDVAAAAVDALQIANHGTGSWQSGGSGDFEQIAVWRFDTGLVAGPGNRDFRFNNATYSLITEVYYNDTPDEPRIDVGLLLFARLEVGDFLLVQQADDATRAVLFTIDTITDNAGDWTLGVTYVADAGGPLISNNNSSINRFVRPVMVDEGGFTSTQIENIVHRLLLDGVATVPGSGAGTLIDVLTDTADIQPKLGTPVADVSADIAAVKVDTVAIQADTDDIQTRLPAALVGGRMDSDVGNIQAAIVTALVDDMWDEDIVAAHGTADTAGFVLRVLAAISQRTNNANLDALLGVADAASVDLPEQINTELETTQGHGAGAWTTGAGITAQAVRDAMKLAPTGGAPAAGSVDEHLDDINTDTAVIALLVSTNLNATVSSRESEASALTRATMNQIEHDATQSDIAALSDIDIVDVQTALTNQGYTVARAGNLDRLDVVLSTRASQTSLDSLRDAIIANDLSAVAGSSTTEIRTGATQADNYYNDMQVLVINASGAAVRNIDGYSQTNGAFTVDALPFTPAISDRVIVLGVSAAGNVDTASIATAVWATLVPGAFGAGEAGNILGNFLDQAISSTEANIRGGGGRDLTELAGAGFLQATDSQEAIRNAVDSVSNVVRVRYDIPELIRPNTGTIDYVLTVMFEDTNGNPEDPDLDTVNVSAEDQTGASLNVNLSALVMTKLQVGVYTVDYTVASTHQDGQVRFLFDYDENAVTFLKTASRTIIPEDSIAPTVQQIVDGVWDELQASHVGVGTTGESLSNAGGSGSPTAVAAAVWNALQSAFNTAGSMGEQVQKLDLTATIGPAAVTTGSMMDRVMNKDANKTFNQSQDSLEAIRDREG